MILFRASGCSFRTSRLHAASCRFLPFPRGLFCPPLSVLRRDWPQRLIPARTRRTRLLPCERCCLAGNVAVQISSDGFEVREIAVTCMPHVMLSGHTFPLGSRAVCFF